MTDSFRLYDFRPLAIHLDKVGPFQRGPVTIEFTKPDGEPADYFLLLSPNGGGKTTVMEAFVHLASLLGVEAADPAAARWRDDFEDARMQLDFRVEYRGGLGASRVAVLSVVDGAGEDPVLFPWLDEQLDHVSAQERVVFGVRRRPGGAGRPLGDPPELVLDLQGLLRAASGRGPTDTDEPTETAPTILYFPSDRDFLPQDGDAKLVAHPDWNHRLVRRFGREVDDPTRSTDYLLVWLNWLDGDGGRFGRAVKLANHEVFRGSPKRISGVRKNPPHAVIDNGGSEHRLDQLSSGERAMVHLFVRLGALMTRNTVVLIDEVDLHLHPSWRRDIVVALKELVRATRPDLGGRPERALTVIFSAHSNEVLDWFDPDTEEPDLAKSGHMILEGFADWQREGGDDAAV